MTDITAPPAKLTRDFGTKADKNFKAIVAMKHQVEEGFLVMGSLLKACRDEKYFTAYGHEKFEHFLGSPELGMSRSMAMGLIQVHELYVLKLDRPTEELVKAGIGKLIDIAPVVEANPDEWMAKTYMSRSDLKAEVREAQGKEPKALLPSDTAGEVVSPSFPEGQGYVDWVRSQGCIICGKAAEPHHFPVTKGAGGKEVADHVIPLCRECHEEAHKDPLGWMTTYKAKWGNYFFNVILMLWPKAKEEDDKKEPGVIDTTCVHVEELPLPPAGDAVEARMDREDMEELALPKPKKGRKSKKSKPTPEGEVYKVVTKYPGVVLTKDEELSADADKTPEELLKEAEPKVMEGFEKFAKCYTCKSTFPESELEGGLCPTCKG